MRSSLSAAILCSLFFAAVVWGQGQVVTEGLAILGGEAWHERGYDGRGTVVAIWDTGFLGYERLVSIELPPPASIEGLGLGIPVTGEPADRAAAHGTAVAEIVHDIAPGAMLRLLASPADVEDPGRAVAALLAWEPDVVVISIYGGIACAAEEGRYERLMRALWEQGILVVVAAGNDATSYWSGEFHDEDGDGWHDFRSYDDDLSFPVYRGDTIDLRFHWGDPCVASPGDYELRLYDHRGELVAAGVADPGAEVAVVRIHLEDLSTGTYAVRVLKAPDAAPAPLHLRWINGRRLEYGTAVGSVGHLLPACSPHVLTVGAVNAHTLWLETFSNQGPASGAALKPELVGPDHVRTVTTGTASQRGGAWIGGFAGTSAAAPHVAGAALLLLQAFPDLSPDELRDLLMTHAIDRGLPGPDPQFGAGIVRLPPPPP
jgi:subtilisin family serine protease